MRRLHLIEIHEQPWCPAVIRNGATDCLTLLENVGGQYRNVLHLIWQALSISHCDHIVDLCSGSGGPWFTLARGLERRRRPGPFRLCLPTSIPIKPQSRGQQATRGRIQRTVRVSNTFRHQSMSLMYPMSWPAFAPSLQLSITSHQIARAILQNAVDNLQGIGIFEQTQRSPLALLLMLTLPIVALLIIPFLRPFRWSRLFWTYVIPAIPCVLCFDGLVSCPPHLFPRRAGLTHFHALFTRLPLADWARPQSPLTLGRNLRPRLSYR